MFQAQVTTNETTWSTTTFTKIQDKWPGKLGYLLHDWDLYRLSRPSRTDSPIKIGGLPETIKVLDPKFVSLTREWQRYWVDLFSLSKYGVLYNDCSSIQKSYLRNAFSGATVGWRAVTNNHGWNNGYADYINGINPYNDPMAQETINFGGNIVELLSDKMQVGNATVYKVRTLNGKRPPPNPLEVNHLTSPLVFRATISRREEYDTTTEKWKREDIVIPFPQLDGNDVPIPFLANEDYNYIRAERVRPLTPDDPIPAIYRF